MALTRAKLGRITTLVDQVVSDRLSQSDPILSSITYTSSVGHRLSQISLYRKQTIALPHCYYSVGSTKSLINTVPANRNFHSLLPNEAAWSVMNQSPTQSPKATSTQIKPEGETSDIPSQSLAFGGSSYKAADKPRPLPIRFHSSDDNNPARRTSVQFMPNVRVAGGATEASRSRSRRPIPINETSATRRLSSPPPPT